MIIELLIALAFGILAGTITGLIPGVHINLVAAGLLAFFSGGYFGISAMVLAVFVVAMAITHTFVDFIPSIFLGAPEEDSFLAVLPGHQLLRGGRGYEAIVLTLYGSLTALLIVGVFSLLFALFLDNVFVFIEGIIPFILVFVSLYLVFREEDFLLSLVVFAFAGFLGLFTFNLPVREPLLPLLTGLFGVSGLIVSLKSGISIPKQKIIKLKDIKLNKKSFLKFSLAASFAAPLCSFLPGIGSGHAAVIGSEITGDFGRDKRSFLFLVGAINTIVMALSFVTIYAIGRTRTGAAAAVEKLLVEITTLNLMIIVAVVVATGVVAFFLGILLAKFFSRNITKINYRKLSFFIILFLLAVNFFLSNLFGILVLVTASALGVFAILSGARRINLMGALLIPTIVFYLTM